MAGRRRFEDELEAEALAERRIINTKKVSSCAHDSQFYFSQTFSIYSAHFQSNMSRNVPRKPAYPPARPPRRQADEYSESEREESEYETDGEDIDYRTFTTSWEGG
jgi:RNA polymerase-associated protein LEO1